MSNPHDRCDCVKRYKWKAVFFLYRSACSVQHHCIFHWLLYFRIFPLSLLQWHTAVPSWVYTTVCVGRKTHEWMWWAWVFRHLVTHTVIFCWEGCPMKIKPASILASIQSREAQWTQAPDRHTDTLPRITGHGPVLTTAKASVVSTVLGWFHHRYHPSAPTGFLCSKLNSYLYIRRQRLTIFSHQYLQLA